MLPGSWVLLSEVFPTVFSLLNAMVETSHGVERMLDLSAQPELVFPQPNLPLLLKKETSDGPSRLSVLSKDSTSSVRPFCPRKHPVISPFQIRTEHNKMGSEVGAKNSPLPLITEKLKTSPTFSENRLA